MPAPEVSERRQLAVLWAFLGYDGFGQPIVSAPVEIMVRWEFKDKQTLNAKGEPLLIDAEAHVGQIIREHSQMWPGSLEDWYSVGSGGQDEVWEVKLYVEVPDVKGRVAFRKVGLRSKSQMPST